MPVTIYHNPRCGKSRAALELIRGRKIEPTIVEYLKSPPNSAELAAILKKLGIGARDLMRTKEAEYKARKLDNPKLTEKQLIDAMVGNPILIERPIVLSGGKAALGRPPENVLKIL
ncbi:MAG: arsenate reductase (glutaredoxin) [Alphaproteobacteria bacterium]